VKRLLRPLRRSLRARLVAYFLLLSTVTVVVVGSIVYVRAQSDLTSSVYDRLEAVVGLKASELSSFIDEQTRNVIFVSVIPGLGDQTRTFLDPQADPDAKSAAEAALRQMLAVDVAQTADAEEIYVVDLDGTVRLSTLPQDEGKSVADQAFFQTGQSHSTVQNAYTSPLSGRPTITVATPIFDRNGAGARVAVVAANVSLQRVDRIVQDRAGLGDTGRAFLVGSDGQLVQGTSAQGVASGKVNSFAVDQLVAQQSGQALYADENNVPAIGVYQWLPSRASGLVAEMSQDEAFGSARQLALTILLVGLLSALLLAIGIWLVARQVTRPILSLASTAAKVQAGDLNATSGVSSEDEVGTLATAFDDMTAELRENVATLERRVEDRTVEIRRQKQYFEALVEVSPVAIVTMDRDERVSGWNPAATALFGFDEEEAMGRHIEELVVRNEELRDHSHNLIAVALEHGRAHTIGRRMRKDGTLLDVEIVVVPLVVDEEHLGFYAIYHDITELQAARRDADAANQAKSAFLAAMSHEIRTPMNAVIGMSGLLMDTGLDEEQRDYTETIHTSGEALLTIINDILDFSKIEAGRFELDLHPIDIAATLEGALDVMGAVAAKKGIELVYAPDPSLPPNAIGDSGRLRQIVLNLLSNALKFTDQGEVVVTVHGTPIDGATQDSGRWRLEVEIKDSGIGIPADRIGRLFQSFTQADASISRRYGGTGLGLAISRRLAELMDGTITAESSGVPGEGSTFRLTAYVTAMPPVAMESAAAGAAPVGERAARVPQPLEGRRVLVVDDNPTNLRILVAQLEQLGMIVAATSSALEGRELASRPGAFDVVVSDMRMPELDGVELAAAVAGSSADAPPVVILSSLGQRDRDAVGVAAFLTKPVKPAALRETLIAVLGGSAVHVAGAVSRGLATDSELATRHPLRILLAEDNAFNIKLAIRLLERMGYRADLAEDGRAALDAVSRTDYDVVLMDVQMPDMDGLEATRRIRSTMPDKPVHIVAMTANAMEGDREACLEAGMNDYLAKPIRPEELAAALVAAPSRGFAAEATELPVAPDGVSMSEAPLPLTPRSAPEEVGAEVAAELTAKTAAQVTANVAAQVTADTADEPQAPVLDPAAMDRLLSLAGGDQGFVDQLVATFIEDAQGQLERMEAAVKSGSMPDLVLASHSLKSNSANAGAARLSAICKSLEADARTGTVPEAVERVAQARAAFDEVRAALAAEGATA
jgi:PAS domain S-box-containing protein